MKIDARSADVLGRAHLADVNAELGLELPEPDDFDTIAGFVIKQLGHIPRQGEIVFWRNTRIRVLEATKRRVEKVRIEIGDIAVTEAETP